MDRPPEAMNESDAEAVRRRPRELAVLLLAMGTDPPRARARDQQADRAGADLQRRILDRIAAIDPEPDDFAAALTSIVTEFGNPSGPSRAICSQLLEEWTQTLHAEGAWGWLISEALERTGQGDEPRRRRRRLDGVS